MRLNQRSKPAKIDPVEVCAASVDALGRFEDEGDVAEARVVDEVSEAGFPDASLADVLVAIDAAAQLALRVVDVNATDVGNADGSFDLRGQRRVIFLRAKVVPGREQMTRVQADAQATRVAVAGEARFNR